MKKKIIGWLLASACALTMLGGCGKQQEKSVPVEDRGTEAAAAAENTAEKQEETVDPSADSSKETGEGKDENELTVVTTRGTTLDILNQAVEPMKEAGITLTVYEEADYLYPNLYVDGEIADANYFQHTVYLDYFNQMMDTDIVGVGDHLVDQLLEIRIVQRQRRPVDPGDGITDLHAWRKLLPQVWSHGVHLHIDAVRIVIFDAAQAEVTDIPVAVVVCDSRPSLGQERLIVGRFPLFKAQYQRGSGGCLQGGSQSRRGSASCNERKFRSKRFLFSG